MTDANYGWIKLHRTLLEHPVWIEEPFNRGQAWVDLLLLANHKPAQIRKRGIKVTVERGQVGWSERQLAERWGWSRGKVRRYLEELETAQQIVQQNGPQNLNVTSLITIVNYENYQYIEPQNEPQNSTTNSTMNKNVKNKRANNHSSVNATTGFEVFYSAYPRKVNRGQAEKAWLKLKPSDELLNQILLALEWQKQKWSDPQYIPHPATYLNCKRWLDEPHTETAKGNRMPWEGAI